MRYDAYWLNRIMDIDHVIRVNPDGTIDEDVQGVHAPESVITTRHDGQIMREHEDAWTEYMRAQGWEPERGWTGQYGYAGPIMHASEFVSGALADHIAETPGLWVAVAVECLPDEHPTGNEDETADYPEPDECQDCTARDEPAGWAVLYRTH